MQFYELILLKQTTPLRSTPNQGVAAVLWPAPEFLTLEHQK